MAVPASPGWRRDEAKPFPARPQPVPEPPQPHRSKGPVWPWLLAGLILGAGVYLWQGVEVSRETAVAVQTPTVAISPKPFAPSLRLTGTVSARDSAAIRAPRLRVRSQLTLTELAEAGTFVEPGAVVARFESRELEDRVDDMRSNVVQALARLDREKAKILVEREATRQQRDAAKAELDKATFDLRKAEVLSEIQAEILRNTAAEAEATWRQLDRELTLQEEVYRRRIRVEEIDVEDAKLKLERYARDLDRMILRAPVGGLIVLEPMYKGGGQFQQAALGDQVYPGTVFLRVVDLSGLHVSASMNQVDSESVRVGMPARIHFDAYPGLTAEGRVSNVGAIAVTGGGGFGASGGTGLFVKNIPVEIDFTTSDPRVIPDLSVSADVLRTEPRQALTVPLSAVEDSGGEPYVRVRAGNSWDRRAVELGERDAVEAVVLGGLRAGEEIAVQNPEHP